MAISVKPILEVINNLKDNIQEVIHNIEKAEIYSNLIEGIPAVSQDEIQSIESIDEDLKILNMCKEKCNDLEQEGFDTRITFYEELKKEINLFFDKQCDKKENINKAINKKKEYEKKTVPFNYPIGSLLWNPPIFDKKSNIDKLYEHQEFLSNKASKQVRSIAKKIILVESFYEIINELAPDFNHFLFDTISITSYLNKTKSSPNEGIEYLNKLKTIFEDFKLRTLKKVRELNQYGYKGFVSLEPLETDEEKLYPEIIGKTFSVINILYEDQKDIDSKFDFVEFIQRKLGDNKHELDEQQFSEQSNYNKKVCNHDIKWNGNNETEFIQLTYGLFFSGKLSNSKNEVTKLVSDLAQILNFKLTNNWQSKLSKGTHKSNKDYEPKIFEEIKAGYLKYRESKIDEKSKKYKKTNTT